MAGNEPDTSAARARLEQLDAFAMPYCTTKQAADLLGVTIRTVQMWVESGVLEAWRTSGGHRRILVQSLRQFLEGKARPGAPATASLNVLLVEDDEHLQQLYQLRLLNSGTPMRLRVVNNGYEALVSIGQEPPNVLISDLLMPEMDGFALLRHLTEMNRTADMKIFVATALTESDIAARGGLPSDVKVYYKPIRFEALEADLRALYAASLAARH